MGINMIWGIMKIIRIKLVLLNENPPNLQPSLPIKFLIS